MSSQIDYTPDTLPDFPMELKGNSAEGNIVEQGMVGYGLHAAPSRPGHGDGVGAPGAFIVGRNPANKTAAGEEMSGNSSFNPTERKEA